MIGTHTLTVTTPADETRPLSATPSNPPFVGSVPLDGLTLADIAVVAPVTFTVPLAHAPAPNAPPPILPVVPVSTGVTAPLATVNEPALTAPESVALAAAIVPVPVIVGLVSVGAVMDAPPAMVPVIVGDVIVGVVSVALAGMLMAPLPGTDCAIPGLAHTRSAIAPTSAATARTVFTAGSTRR